MVNANLSNGWPGSPGKRMALALLAALPLAAAAYVPSETVGFSVSTDLSERFFTWGYVEDGWQQGRFSYEQYIAAVGCRILPGLSYTAGVRLLRVYPKDPTYRNDYSSMNDLIYRFPEWRGFCLRLRGRLEYRNSRNYRGGGGYRSYCRYRAEAMVSRKVEINDIKLYPYVAEEVYFQEHDSHGFMGALTVWKQTLGVGFHPVKDMPNLMVTPSFQICANNRSHDENPAWDPVYSYGVVVSYAF